MPVAHFYYLHVFSPIYMVLGTRDNPTSELLRESKLFTYFFENSTNRYIRSRTRLGGRDNSGGGEEELTRFDKKGYLIMVLLYKHFSPRDEMAQSRLQGHDLITGVAKLYNFSPYKWGL